MNMEPEKLSTSLLDLDQEAEQKKNIKHNKINTTYFCSTKQYVYHP